MKSYYNKSGKLKSALQMVISPLKAWHTIVQTRPVRPFGPIAVKINGLNQRAISRVRLIKGKACFFPQHLFLFWASLLVCFQPKAACQQFYRGQYLLIFQLFFTEYLSNEQSSFGALVFDLKTILVFYQVILQCQCTIYKLYHIPFLHTQIFIFILFFKGFGVVIGLEPMEPGKQRKQQCIKL